jgi:hypothetical protein
MIVWAASWQTARRVVVPQGGIELHFSEQISATRVVEVRKSVEESIGKAGFGIVGGGKIDHFRGPWKHPSLKTRRHPRQAI